VKYIEWESKNMGSEEVLYEVAQRKLSDQLQSVNELDTKAATLFAFASGLLVFFGAILSLGNIGSKKAFATILAAGARVPLTYRVLFFIVLIVALVLYLFVLNSLRLAYRVNSRWVFRPTMEWLEDACKRHTQKEMQILVARQCGASLAQNRGPLERKAKYVEHALNLIAIESILAGLTGLVALLGR